MSYLVLARKYRPQTFGDLVGQEHVTTTLVNALQAKRLAHAYVFSGPRGCGKTTTARLLAKALNCVQGPTPTPCGACAPCVEIAQGASPDDVLEIDGASNRGIDQIRELRDTVKYAPARARYRVFIIDEAHQITEAGFNALLKTLEEPPPHAVFMMATTESQKIPGTILSRCQRFQLRSIAAPAIQAQLKKVLLQEGITVADDALSDVARAAHGSLRDALSLLDQVLAYAPNGASSADVRTLLGLLPQAFIRSFTAVLRDGSSEKVLQSIRQALDDGFDLGQLADDLLEHYHRLLLVKAGAGDPTDPDAAALATEAAEHPIARLELDLRTLARCVADMRRSETPRIVFELAALELAQHPLPVDDILERLEALEKGGGPRLAPAPTMSSAPRTAPVAPAAHPIATTPLPTPPPPPIPSAPQAVEQRYTPTPTARGPLSDAVVRDTWTRAVAEIGARKPSLEALLLSAHCHRDGETVEILCANEFQLLQIQNGLPLITEILRQHLGTGLPVRCAKGVVPARSETAPVPPPASPVRTPAASPPSAPASNAPPAPVTDEEPPEDIGGDEDPPPSTEAPPPAPAVLEGPETEAPADPGLQKVLKKFPGKLKRIVT